LCSLSITPVYCRAGVVVNYNTIFWLVKGLVLAAEGVVEICSAWGKWARKPRQCLGLINTLPKITVTPA
jgi:hypothetical protein